MTLTELRQYDEGANERPAQPPGARARRRTARHGPVPDLRLGRQRWGAKGGHESSRVSAEAAGLEDKASRTPIHRPRLLALVVLVDALMLALSGGLSFALAGPREAIGVPMTAGVIGLVVVASLGFIQHSGGYAIDRLKELRTALARPLLALGWVFALAFALAYLLAGESAGLRFWLAGWSGAAVLGLALARLGVARLMAAWSRARRLQRRAVIIGGGATAAALLRRLRRSAADEIEVLGVFDDRRSRWDDSGALAGLDRLGSFADLEAYCRRARIDLLIVNLPTVAEARILTLLKRLWVLPVDIRLSALGSKLRLQSRAYTYIGDVPFLPLFDKPLDDWGWLVKELEDRFLGALLLLLAAPLMALIALAVKLDSRGPVFFRQKRYGFNNELIEVFKFRSMYVEAADENAERLVTRNDPRVTRVGRFIRKTSLDELPQLINVVRGELSLVGPRPHALKAKAENRLYEEVVEGYFARHRVKPGITGWAQINGWRGETDSIEKIEKRVAHDLYYIDNWSLLFDLVILALTPIALLRGENAY